MSTAVTESELDLVVEACRHDLGPPAQWIAPDGYPASLALSVIDAVFSINARYEGVVNVVDRYRRRRAGQHGDANTDGVIEL